MDRQKGVQRLGEPFAGEVAQRGEQGRALVGARRRQLAPAERAEHRRAEQVDVQAVPLLLRVAVGVHDVEDRPDAGGCPAGSAGGSGSAPDVAADLVGEDGDDLGVR